MSYRTKPIECFASTDIDQSPWEPEDTMDPLARRLAKMRLNLIRRLKQLEALEYKAGLLPVNTTRGFSGYSPRFYKSATCYLNGQLLEEIE
jgi:hypothetical protein